MAENKAEKIIEKLSTENYKFFRTPVTYRMLHQNENSEILHQKTYRMQHSIT